MPPLGRFAPDQSSDWQLCRQSSMDELVSKSPWNSDAYLKLGGQSTRSDILHSHMYLKLKKRLLYGVLASLSCGVRHNQNRLPDRTCIGGS
ncbi:hypothetical protein KP509_16G071700 [Ceratopteris richardii]|nr:hypothetical protein KP509_16G071700 [Ceratopteris richardii]